MRRLGTQAGTYCEIQRLTVVGLSQLNFIATLIYLGRLSGTLQYALDAAGIQLGKSKIRRRPHNTVLEFGCL
jgi:hypothetical protein